MHRIPPNTTLTKSNTLVASRQEYGLELQSESLVIFSFHYHFYYYLYQFVGIFKFLF